VLQYIKDRHYIRSTLHERKGMEIGLAEKTFEISFLVQGVAAGIQTESGIAKGTSFAG
jgi:hypothetical protein